MKLVRVVAAVTDETLGVVSVSQPASAAPELPSFPGAQARRHSLSGVVLVVAIALSFVGCGDNDSTSGRRSTAGTSVSRDVAPIPPLPDPAPALACTGREVVCVDAAAAAAAPDGSAEKPFASVSAALAAAKARTVIQVAAGVYEEELVLAEVKDVRLVGGFRANGGFSERDPVAHETVLQGAGKASIIEVSASSGIHIEGFRITGGGGRFDGSNYHGGGVYIDETSTDVSIVGNRIDGNSVDRGDEPSYALGGGIASNGKAVKIVGNVVDANRAGRGGGIAVIGEASIERNTITENVGVGDHGGGLNLSGDVTVAGNRVEGNRVGTDYGWAGGINVFGDGTSARLRGNVVRDNAAPTAGSGVFIDDGADATLVGELYYANRCTTNGGVGLYVDSGGETPTVAEIVTSPSRSTIVRIPIRAATPSSPRLRGRPIRHRRSPCRTRSSGTMTDATSAPWRPRSW